MSPRRALVKALLLCTAFLLFPFTLAAHSGLELPSPAKLKPLASEIFDAATSPLWQCSSDSRLPCDQVSFDSIVLFEVERGSEALRAARVELAPLGLVAENLEARGDRSGFQVTLGPGNYSVGVQEVTFESLRILLVDGGELHHLEFSGLRWDHGELGGAVTSGSGWEVYELRGQGLSRWVASTGVNEETSGWLPPRVMVGSDGAAVEGSYYFANPSLAVGVRGDLATSAGLFVSARDGDEALRLDLRVDANPDVEAILSGERGLRGQHLRSGVALDGVRWRSGDAPVGQGERLAAGLFFRTWQSQRAGLALENPNQSLQLRVNHYSPGLSAFGLDDDTRGELWLEYGTSVRFSGRFRGDLALSHGELAGEHGARETRVFGDFSYLFGRASRAWARPGIRTDLGFFDGSTEGGSDPVESESALDLYVRSGLAFRGGGEGWSHGISPGVQVGRRLWGSTRAANFLALRLDQVLNIGRAGELSIGLPAEALLYDDGRGDDVNLALRGGLRVATPLGSVEAQVLCDSSCQDRRLRGSLHLALPRGLESIHGIYFQEGTLEGMPLLDRRPSRLYLLIDNPSPGGIAHLQGLRWRSRRGLYLEGSLHGAVQGEEEIQARGLGLGLDGGELAFGIFEGPLGWGLEARGALRRDGEWATLVGLRASPAP